MGQQRLAFERYFGGVLFVTDPAGGPNTRRVHWEEAHGYAFSIPTTVLTVLLPYDVSNYPTGGPVLTIWNHGLSAQNLEIKDQGGTTIPSGLLVPGQVGLVFLTDVSTAAGSWQCLRNIFGPHTPHS